MAVRTYCIDRLSCTDLFCFNVVMHGGGYYVFMMFHCLFCCPNIQCQHGLICRAGKSADVQQQKHHSSLLLFSYIYVYYCI